MFSGMIADIQEEIVRIMYYAQLVEQPRERRNVVAQHSSASALGEARGDDAGRSGELPGGRRVGPARGGAIRAGAGARGVARGARTGAATGAGAGATGGQGGAGTAYGQGGQGGQVGQGGQGDVERPRQQPVTSDKIGRNDPCPCGSGLKYKKCCGKSA